MSKFKVGDIITCKMNYNTLGVLKQKYNGKARIIELKPNGWAIVEIINTTYKGFYAKQREVYLLYFEKEIQIQYRFCDGECEIITTQITNNNK